MQRRGKDGKFEKDPLAEYRRPVRGSVKHVAQVEREHKPTDQRREQ